MRSTAAGDVLKSGFYAAAAVWIGAWISPLFYNAGKALAEVSATKLTNRPLSWLAARCHAAEFPDFFKVSLLVAAAVLFVPFMRSLRGGGGEAGLRGKPRGGRQAAAGFLLVAMTFLMLAGGLLALGVFEWKPVKTSIPGYAWQALVVALGLAVFQEILFRGILLGIFLRAMRPAFALAGVAVFFAMVHFLNPPPGLNVVDPDAAGVGFELLGKILAQFAEPRLVLGIFAPWLALGGVLAFARWRTASLGLPIGLHAGWIFSHAMLPLLTGKSVPGVVSLAVIIFVGLATEYLTRPTDAATTPL